MTFQPLLSGKAPDDLTAINYPVLVSPKLDGIRCVVHNGEALTRKLKLVPNRSIQAVLGCADYEGLDGELIVGEPCAPDTWNNTQSGVMSRDGEPDFTFHVFDDFTDPHFDFETRLHAADARVRSFVPGFLRIVHHEFAHNVNDILRLQDKWVSRGYEGLMLRSPAGLYKFGRSTSREGILLKLKIWDDDEATVIGFVEQMKNTSEKEIDERGYSKRSKRKANQEGKGTLGALVCAWRDTEFEIGTGFDDEQRAEIWARRQSYKGAQVKFKLQGTTPDGKPRFPTYLGIRDARD